MPWVRKPYSTCQDRGQVTTSGTPLPTFWLLHTLTSPRTRAWGSAGLWTTTHARHTQSLSCPSSIRGTTATRYERKEIWVTPCRRFQNMVRFHVCGIHLRLQHFTYPSNRPRALNCFETWCHTCAPVYQNPGPSSSQSLYNPTSVRTEALNSHLMQVTASRCRCVWRSGDRSIPEMSSYWQASVQPAQHPTMGGSWWRPFSGRAREGCSQSKI